MPTIQTTVNLRQSQRRINRNAAAASANCSFSNSASLTLAPSLKEHQSLQSASDPAAEIDQHVNMRVWLLTVENGKNYGWCEEIIKGKDKNGDYVANYTEWGGKYNAIISDLYDESEVMLHSPTPVEVESD